MCQMDMSEGLKFDVPVTLRASKIAKGFWINYFEHFLAN